MAYLGDKQLLDAGKALAENEGFKRVHQAMAKAAAAGSRVADDLAAHPERVREPDSDRADD